MSVEKKSALLYLPCQYIISLILYNIFLSTCFIIFLIYYDNLTIDSEQ